MHLVTFVQIGQFRGLQGSFAGDVGKWVSTVYSFTHANDKDSKSDAVSFLVHLSCLMYHFPAAHLCDKGAAAFKCNTIIALAIGQLFISKQWFNLSFISATF